MRISITKKDRTITIEREDYSLEHLLDEFISCLLVLDYDSVEINNEFIKIAEILKNRK